jgi:hypothetical protein
MWFESFEEDVEYTGMRSWRWKPQDPQQWRAVLEEAKVHQGLY